MKSDNVLQGMRAVLLAGGRGTRLLPYTTVLPKPLMPIGNLPILEIVISQLRRFGIKDITLSVGYLASLLEAYFGDGNRLGVSICYSREAEPLGTAGPLRLVQGLTETFLVMNGDLLTSFDFSAIMRFHQDRGAAVTVGLYKKQIQIDLGVIEADHDGKITDYVEKPTLSYEVSVGIYVMEPIVLKYIPSGQRFDLPDLIKALIAEKQPVLGYRFDGYWLDIGRHEDYAQATELFERERAVFLPNEM